MTSLHEDHTSQSLIARLKANEASAWTQLVQRYVPVIYRWCRTWHLQEADAQDLTQQVLLKLSRRMQVFRYDPTKSFRAYLKTLARYAWCDLVAERQKPGAEGGGSVDLDQLESKAAHDDLVRRTEEHDGVDLLKTAMEVVQSRVQPQTWQAFRLTAVEGLSGANTSSQLGISVTAVYKARSRVQQLLRRAVAAEEDG